MRWFRARFGSTHWMLGYTPPAGSFSVGLSVQPFPGGAFGSAERALFRLLFDHFESALRIAARPPSLAAERATIVVGPRGEVLALSPPAEALVRARDGILIQDGRVEALHPPSRPTFARLIRSALEALTEGTAGGMIALPRGPGRQPLIVSATPLPAPAGSLAAFLPGALLHIADPQARPSSGLHEAMRGVFGLTPAEARLAEALLAADGNLREVAAVLGITHGTARAQLARIFDKTGARTQSSLIRLLTLIAAVPRR